MTWMRFPLGSTSHRPTDQERGVCVCGGREEGEVRGGRRCGPKESRKQGSCVMRRRREESEEGKGHVDKENDEKRGASGRRESKHAPDIP